MSKTIKQQVQPLTILVILTLVGGIFFIEPYLSVAALALLTAYIFNPVYLYLSTKTKSGLAMTLTVFAALFTAVIPISIIMLLAFGQLTTLFDSVNNGSFSLEGQSIQQVSTSISETINEVGESVLGVQEAVSSTEVTDFVLNFAPKVLDGAIGIVSGLVTSVPSFFALFIIFLFLFTGALRYQKSLVATILGLSPFDEKLTKKYFAKIGAMAKAMLKGQLIIATVQGFIGAASLLFIGLGDYFLVFAILFSFLNLIPLGSGLITMPIGAIALVTGNVGAGVLILATHFIVVTNVDNILRPKLVPDDAFLPASLLILSTFAGVAWFGLLGVVYGPIIMIFITTTIESYLEQKSVLSKDKPKKT